MQRAALLGCVFAMFLAGVFQPSLCSAQAGAGSQAVANRQAVLSQARSAYYSLHSHGMVSFQCDVTPDWNMLLAEQKKQDPDGEQKAVQTLNQLHFTVNVAPDSTANLTHNELTGQSQQMMDALKQIYSGMEQMVSGFFETWKVFMFSPPFPEADSTYELVDLGPRYRLTYKDGDAEVATTMGHDFAIDTMSVSTARFDSSIQPIFNSTSDGFVLSGYNASYKSQNPGETTLLNVNMEYGKVQGLQMLSKLNIAGSYGGSSFPSIALTFSNCQVTAK